MQDKKILIDTNIWIYLFTNQDTKKKTLVKELISSLLIKPIIPMQVYKEIARVLKDKIGLSLEQSLNILNNIKRISVVMEEYPEDINLALKLREKYSFQFFDSIIYAFALNRDIPVVLTEDVPVEKIFYRDRILVLKNPFK